MAQALDVARYLIQLATEGGEDADTLCHMRLQKLLYYVQGWHLATRGKPLFADKIEAWPYGPVVASLYPRFKPYGLTIPPQEGGNSQLSEKDKAFVYVIWDRYKRYSGLGLKDMTHRESPWLEANARRSVNDRFSSPEITTQAMRDYFFPRFVELLQRQDSRIEPQKWLASAEAIASGRVRTAKDIRRELHRNQLLNCE